MQSNIVAESTNYSNMHIISAQQPSNITQFNTEIGNSTANNPSQFGGIPIELYNHSAANNYYSTPTKKRKTREYCQNFQGEVAHSASTDISVNKVPAPNIIAYELSPDTQSKDNFGANSWEKSFYLLSPQEGGIQRFYSPCQAAIKEERIHSFECRHKLNFDSISQEYVQKQCNIEYRVAEASLNKKSPSLTLVEQLISYKKNESAILKLNSMCTVLYPIPKGKAKTKDLRENACCCTCKKSHCLKLYCDCFSRGILCEGCHCISCENNDLNNAHRLKAMSSTKIKRVDAFMPKIVSKEGEQVHAKGCKCKKSGCSKKYCECFQSGIKCGEHCVCSDCSNKC